MLFLKLERNQDFQLAKFRTEFKGYRVIYERKGNQSLMRLTYSLNHNPL